MDHDKFIERLKTIRTDLMKELSYINGKHDAIMNEIALINLLLNDLDGFTEEDE